jgi:retinol dehydrogenase-12
MSSSPEMGALTQLYAATAPEAANSNGKARLPGRSLAFGSRRRQYFLPWARESGFIPEVNDPEKAQRLWAWFEAQVKEI